MIVRPAIIPDNRLCILRINVFTKDRLLAPLIILRLAQMNHPGYCTLCLGQRRSALCPHHGLRVVMSELRLILHTSRLWAGTSGRHSLGPFRLKCRGT